MRQLVSDAQKSTPVESSLSILPMLKSQEHRAWYCLATLDESWFYSNTDYESIWPPPGEKVAEMPRVTIPCKQLMITIVWDPSGFNLIGVLPSGHKLNSSYSRKEILEPLSEWRRAQAGRAGRKLIVHADTACPQTAAASHEFMDENGLERAIHPLYS
jgi:hypothetical protein